MINRTINMEDHLIDALSRASSVDIAVSFLRESGYSILSTPLSEALSKGVRVRILTGTYLGITSPFVLEELMDLQGDVEIRLFSDPDVSFHPKSYIFHHPDREEDVIYIGSSNLSASALSEGVEWNYRLLRMMDPISFDRFQSEFDRLFAEESVPLDRDTLERYRSSWKRPPIPRDVFKPEVPSPRGPQISALAALRRTRAEGMDKALVVASTGVGKTFIAAKDSEGYGSVLFVAHRREILEQAEKTFKKIHIGKTTGFLYGGCNQSEADLLFASVQTLSMDRHLSRFPPDRFDYIVFDEFHHAVSDSYRKVVEHFQPRFLLGLTATPERLDRKDIFVLCDYNVPYEIGLADAIRFGSLVPFTYHGIADDVDYDKIAYKNGRYDQDELSVALSNEKRANLIINHYMKHRTSRALGFCSSIEHAQFMKERFESNGIRSMCVVSNGGDDRHDAVAALEEGTVSVVFTVDMFNEGVDIPSVDMVMFLRPTESPAVFLQQLGRGLRTHSGKERLTVIDFIGNYRKVDMIPSLLTGVAHIEIDPREIERRAPEECVIDFDLTSIDIMQRMARRRMKMSELIDSEFDRVMQSLGHVPSRKELFLEMDHSLMLNDKGFMKDYLGYLVRRELATPLETSIQSGPGGDFIRMVENTGMSRLYKMPVVLAFFRDGRFTLHVTDEDIAESFREFYSKDGNRVDLEVSKSRKPPELMTDADWIKLAKENPVRFLTKTEGRFFSTNESGLDLSNDLGDVGSLPDFKRHVLDAVGYRTLLFKEIRYTEMRKDE